SRSSSDRSASTSRKSDGSRRVEAARVEELTRRIVAIPSRRPGSGTMGGRMEAIFTPRSIAVYGASRDERKLGPVLLRNALAGGFAGPVVAVNPAGGEVLGRRTVPALEGPVDLALVSVPAGAAQAAVADAACAGCRAAIVLASGFGETGEAGRA